MPDSLRRALYQEMLREELGRNPSGVVGDPPRRSWSALVAPIAIMLVLAMLVLLGAFALSLWQRGAFTPVVSSADADTPWQRLDRTRPPEDLTPQKSEVEAEPVVPPAEEEAPSEPQN